MKNRLVKMIPVVLFPLLTWLISAPAGLETETWHMFGLCLSLLCGLILKPFFRAGNQPDCIGTWGLLC